MPLDLYASLAKKISPSAMGLVALAWSVSAAAQVNTEPLRKKLKAKGWSATVQGSLDSHGGNTHGVDASAAGGFGVATDRHLAFIFGSAEFARYNGVDAINNSFLHARYNYEFTPWLWGEVFGQLQSDAFQRILLRDLVGLGPRFGVYLSKELDIYFGTGWMVEHDAIAVLPGSNDRADYYAHRWNNYISVNYLLDTRASVASTLYVEPRWNDFGDYRILEQASLTFKITPILSVSIIGNYHYDSHPPSGTVSTDVEVKNVLAITF